MRKEISIATKEMLVVVASGPFASAESWILEARDNTRDAYAVSHCNGQASSSPPIVRAGACVAEAQV